ncbi:hypothetical protein [Nocardia sp. NPDC006630]|uniref:hypothetical protein n=1 Tax=Nocardia sp. NPDC006630 TaxID=3157181 RepID=UPI0033B4FC3A
MVIPPGSGPSQSAFPVISGKPAWPVRLTFSRFVVPAILFAIALLLAIAGVVTLVGDGIAKSNLATAIGACGSIAVAVGVLLMGMAASGSMRRNRLGAKHLVSDDHGAGVVVRSVQLTPIILLLLGGIAVYGISAWISWKRGTGGDLLPMSKENSGGATIGLVLGVVAAVMFAFFVVIYTKWTVELYPDGIRRVMSSPVLRIRKENFVDWDGIEAIVPTTVRTSAQTGGRPLIELRLRIPREEVQHKQWDSADCVVLPAFLLAGEPNTLLAILQFLKDNPEQRGLLARPDAAIWFATPATET